jgi:hypothetical protein
MVVGDALLVLATLALVFALAYPRIRRTAMRDHIAQAVADVEAVVDAAARFRAEQGTWPPASESGTVPPPLAPYLPAGFSFTTSTFSLEMDVWETAREAPPPELPPPPPTGQDAPPPPSADETPPSTVFGAMGGITVRADDPRILAGLMDHFAGGRAFLHRGGWTLIIPTPPED